jgi:hypothetical protein
MAKRSTRKASKQPSLQRKETGDKGGAGVNAEVRRGSLDEWLEGVRSFAAERMKEGAERGACLVPDPAGGPAICVQVDKETCKLMKGTFIGGPC